MPSDKARRSRRNKGYSGTIVHYPDFVCGARSFYPLPSSNNKNEVTCKVCIAKKEFDNGSPWPEELGRGASKNQ